MSPEADIELEWEDWDGRSPFFHHCIAGSIAGVAEHTVLYPFDTIKTHMQAYCSTCPKNPANQTLNMKGSRNPLSSTATDGNMWATMRKLTMKSGGQSPISVIIPKLESSSTATNNSIHSPTVPQASATYLHIPTNPVSTSAEIREVGFLRLWRGVQSVALGSAPAHALYFSSYEAVKAGFLSYQKQQQQPHEHTPSQDLTLGPVAASVAGATATFLHDTIMCPMDTIKQRMQLGHYTSVYDAFVTIVKTSGEGWMGLYRSFGVTLLSNLPYGVIMFTTNEWLRGNLLQLKYESNTHQQQQQQQQQQQHIDLSTTLIAGMGAGTIASGLTSPLDRVKTRLQTQNMGIVLPSHGNMVETSTSMMKDCGIPSAGGKSCAAMTRPQYTGFQDALGSILKEEGYIGLWRGVGPRILTQAPAVAISWSFYEMAKRWLVGDSML